MTWRTPPDLYAEFRFMAINTGMERPFDGIYSGTVTSDNGIVWHVYDWDEEGYVLVAVGRRCRDY